MEIENVSGENPRLDTCYSDQLRETLNHNPTSRKTYLFVVSILAGISGLLVAGAGIGINSMITIMLGGGLGILFLIPGIVGLVKDRIKPPCFFSIVGKAEWEMHFGDVGEEPPLREDIVEIMNSPCPFSPNLFVRETHILFLIPATVRRGEEEEPLTLTNLNGWVEGGIWDPSAPRMQQALSIENQQEREESYWVLIRKATQTTASRLAENYRSSAPLERLVCDAMQLVGGFTLSERESATRRGNLIIGNCLSAFFTPGAARAL